MSSTASTAPLPPYTPPVGYTPGSITMGDKRQQALKKSFPAYQGSQTPNNIRIDALTTANEQWGVSADENVRTQILRDNYASMKPQEAEYAYMQRSHQGNLVYKTSSGVLEGTYAQAPGKAKTPLAAHTPGVKTEVSPGTKGALTAEHGTRDKLRATVVEKTLADAQRGDFDIGMMGKAATLQLLMSPAEELSLVEGEVTSGTQEMHSVLTDVGKISDPVGFQALLAVVQEVREYEKLELASEMIRHGRGELVPDAQKKLLIAAGGDPKVALALLRQESLDPTSTFAFNTATYSQTGRLDQHSLRELQEAAKQNTPYPKPLSPSRKLPKKAKNPFL